MLGPLMIDIEGESLSAEDAELLRHPLICGVILFARNFRDPMQVGELVTNIHRLRTPRLLVAVDQEGGRVQRFRNGFVELPPLAAIGEIYDQDADAGLAAASDHAWMMGSELKAVGIDFSFAPVLDLFNAHSAVIGERAFHRNPQVVAHLGQAYSAALSAIGMAAIGKHFPGHGSVAEDSHHELPEDRRDLTDLEQSDLVPFRMLVRAGIPGLMMAHVLYPNIDGRVAGFSDFWIKNVLREQMGFTGVVFSDDLSMEGAAAAGGYDVRARAALDAGCDVLLVCNNRAASIAIIDALGAEKFPQTQARLMRLHGHGSRSDLATLQQSARWRTLKARFEQQNPFPELGLGDDNLLS